MSVMRPSKSLTDVFIYRNPIDFRNAHRDLIAIIELELGHYPFADHFYPFTNRQRNKIKYLYWEDNGFVLYYKSLFEEKFAAIAQQLGHPLIFFCYSSRMIDF